MISSRRLWLGLVLAGFLSFCAILRAPINVIPPLVPRIGADTGMSSVMLGALTSLPVLCYGLATPACSGLLRKTGANTGGLITLSFIVIGALIRCIPGTLSLFAGTVVMGLGITVGNLVAPMIIGRDFWHKTATMTGLYSATCNVWVTACTALAVPTAMLVGWRGSAGLWAVVPTAAAMVVWLYVYPPGLGRPRGSLLRRSGMIHWVHETPAQIGSGAAKAVWRRLGVWLMALAFACHTFSYYAILGWLPTVLADLAHMSDSAAGVASSVFSLTGIIGPLLVPVMFERLHWSGRRVLMVLVACWVALPLVLVLAPGAWLVPCIFSGIAQGAFFAALFTIVIQRAASIDENRQMTALIQTSGYVVAAMGPVALGWLHTVSGGWLIPFTVVLAIMAVMAASSWIVSAPPSSPRAPHKSDAGAGA